MIYLSKSIHLNPETVMSPHPHIASAIRNELSDWRVWVGRAVVLGFAALAGLTVVAFTWLCELALEYFFVGQIRLARDYPWLPWIWTPLIAALITWITRRWVLGAAGSGIPQVMAALTPGVEEAQRPLFVSLRLSLAKMLLTALGLLGGLSLGREGPSVQIAAGVMHHARRWLPERSQISTHGLLMAGGAAGIAAAFNTPLGGVMFAIEELTRRPEQRSNGLLLAAIVLAGLMAVSVYGNATYFGVIQVEDFSWTLLWPAAVVTLFSGIAGGLFSRLLVVSLSGQNGDWFSRLRQRSPVWFAALCGLGVAALGWASLGETYGSGYAHTRNMLDNSADASPWYTLLKFIATWLTAWSGVPGGIFAPSLAIGGALGNDVAQLTGYAHHATLIALGMAGFLAAATQAPITAFIIVMEMVSGHALVLSLMACALVANGISRLISAPLYTALAQLQLRRLPTPPAASESH